MPCDNVSLNLMIDAVVLSDILIDDEADQEVEETDVHTGEQVAVSLRACLGPWFWAA